MRRREFLALTGGAVVTWPLVARAQDPAPPVIGFLGAVSPDGFTERVRAFRQGLKEAGFVSVSLLDMHSPPAAIAVDRFAESTEDRRLH
jgi:putative ABC transport system substrate-binding protein